MKAMSNTKRIRRTCAAILVLVLTLGQCFTVFADEIGSDILSASPEESLQTVDINDGQFEEAETGFTTDDLSYDGFADESADPEDIISDTGSAADGSTAYDELDDAVKTPVTRTGNLSAEDISRAMDEQTPEEFITGTLGMSLEAFSSPDTGIISGNKINDNEFEAIRYPNRVTVENKNTIKGLDTTIYAVLIYSDPEKQGQKLMWGTKVSANEIVSLYSVHDKDDDQIPLDSTSDYTLLLGRCYQYEDEYTHEIYKEDMGFIGYMPEYDAEGNIIKYVKFNILNNDGKGTTLKANSIVSDNNLGYRDGYSEIKLKASVQKNMKIKFSWVPNKKDAEQKDYKKYELYEITKDSTSETGYKETRRWPASGMSTAKKATLNPGLDKETLLLKSSMLYVLKCYDKSGTLKAQYATAAAPYLFEMQSGTVTGNFDYTISQTADDPAKFFCLELAEKNKEKSEKAPGGFQEEWRSLYNCDELSLYSKGDYPITSKLTTEAVSMEYCKTEPEVVLGKKYYGRVKTIAYIGGLKVTSGPSNVLNCKAGPDKCYVIDIAGVIYDKADAKNGNSENTERANKHLEQYLNDTIGEEPLSGNSIYIHEDNSGTCAKSGMVFFQSVGDESNIKAYELLRSDKPNGKYKKVKSYGLNSKALLSCTVKDLEGDTIRALHYTNFPPEKDYYYAVRAVSKAGSAKGGFGYGFPNHSEADKVQIFDSGIDKSPTAIEIGWLHDDCVKQYWIYRSETSFGDITEAKGSPIAKVSAKSVKKYKLTDESGRKTGETICYHLYVDKKVITDKRYYYYIRPIYNTKEAARNNKYNIDKVSHEIVGKATAKFAQIKNFKAANNGVESIKLSFSQQKGITDYRIWRLEVDSNTSTKIPESLMPDIMKAKNPDESYDKFEDRISGWKLDEWITFFNTYKAGNGNPWTYAGVYNGSGSSTKSATFKDDGVAVGHYYFYMIQGATKESSGLIFTYTGRIQNVPLPVENLKAEYAGNGSVIKVSWDINSKDSGKVKVQIDAGNGYKTLDHNHYNDYGLSRGNERTYKVRVVYIGDYSIHSKVSEVKCSLPTKINVSNSEITLKVGQEGKISATAVRDNGQPSTENNVEFSTPSGIIEIKKDGNSCKIKAKNTGETTIRCSCAGVSRDIKVKVIN